MTKIDRYSPMAAQWVCERLLPEPASREAILRVLAESIVLACTVNPNAWSVTLNPGMIRLNTGKIETLTIVYDRIHLVINRAFFSAAFQSRTDISFSPPGQALYASVPKSMSCDFPPQLAFELLPLLRPAHDSVIRMACKAKGTPYRRAYSPGIVDYLSIHWANTLPHPAFYSPPANHPPPALNEGTSHEILTHRYERNPLARQQCLEHYGYSCVVCGFNFQELYGPLGEGYIHVHHIVPLANIGQTYSVDPIADLRPVCPNCHAMIHRNPEPMTIEGLKKLIQSK